MKFRDIAVFRAGRFSVGIEEDSGRFYISIPVSNGVVDYEEYYEISKEFFEKIQNDADAALSFVERCRLRQVDELLIMRRGRNRGIAV